MKLISLILSIVAFANISFAGETKTVVQVMSGVDYSSHWMNPNIITARVGVECWKENSKVTPHFVKEPRIDAGRPDRYSLVTVLTYDVKEVSKPGPVCLSHQMVDIKIDLAKKGLAGAWIDVVGGEFLQLEAM